jgi:hypothetical protein
MATDVPVLSGARLVLRRPRSEDVETRFDRGRWRIAIRDLGDSHYELLDVDRHDRIDRRYSD